VAYIGNQPFTAAFLVDTFSGTGSQTAFTMTVAPANTSSILVSITGVVQDPSTYSVSGTTLTFSAAPPSGTSNISVRYLGIPASGVTTTAYRTVTNFTATAGQTSFSVPSYTVGYIDVYRNGVRLVSTDYTATTGTTVVLANACTVGDAVVTESFYVSSVLNAIPATAGSVSDSYIVSMAGSKLTGTQVIPKATLPTGSILQVQSATTNASINTSSTTYQLTGLTLTITPVSSSSKFLLMLSGGMVDAENAASQGCLAFYRNGSTYLGSPNGRGVCQFYTSGSRIQVPASGMFYDTPATASAITYAVYIKSTNSTSVWFNTDGSYPALTVMEIAA
jgi:hypothetical protein